MNILCTGANGFLGKHLVRRLRALGHNPFLVPSKLYDLRSQASMTVLFGRKVLFEEQLKRLGTLDILFHLAADIGGIEYNLKNPASIYYNNVMMNTLLINKACQVGVKKFVFVSSVCIYPQITRLPMKEDWLFRGNLEKSNEAYGASKLMSLVHLRACQKQYGLNFAYPILANLYGPGDGGFFNDDKSHVVSALVKRIYFAKGLSEPQVKVWGDGSATRDLLYVKDAAEALTKFLEVDYNKPVNIATGQEVKVSEIVALIVKYTGYKGHIEYSVDRPTGQNRRCYDTTRARKFLGWQSEIGIEEGLKRVVKWYKQL